MNATLFVSYWDEIVLALVEQRKAVFSGTEHETLYEHIASFRHILAMETWPYPADALRMLSDAVFARSYGKVTLSLASSSEFRRHSGGALYVALERGETRKLVMITADVSPLDYE